MSSSKKKQISSPMSLDSLPDDTFIDIIARVPARYYPTTLSLVSKSLRSLVTSPELYARRSLLGCTEHCLYVALYNNDTDENRWYVLERKPNGGFRLVLIESLPAMPYHGNFVAAGSKIYVFGPLDEALSIDCRSHTVQPLPSLPVPMIDKVAEVVDGKIYVIGRFASEIGNLRRILVVFDTETQMWKPQMKIPAMVRYGMHPSCVVMADKIYMSGVGESFISYRPKDGNWERERMQHDSCEGWQYACVIDDVLYYYDYVNMELKAYDPYQRFWRVVKGVKELLPKAAKAQWSSYTANYGGRLAVFLPVSYDSGLTSEIWCAEISLERRLSGEIWGKIERCDVVINGEFTVIKPLTLKV